MHTATGRSSVTNSAYGVTQHSKPLLHNRIRRNTMSSMSALDTEWDYSHLNRTRSH
eukprot:IDg15702t1